MYGMQGIYLIHTESSVESLVPVVQKEDNALHWMNLCPQYLSAG